MEEVKYVSPEPDGDVYLAEYFDDPEAIGTKWVKSQAKKEGTDESLAKYDGVSLYFVPCPFLFVLFFLFLEL